MVRPAGLGTTQGADALVYERPDHPEWGFGATVTDDGRYLVITATQGNGREGIDERMFRFGLRLTF